MNTKKVARAVRPFLSQLDELQESIGTVRITFQDEKRDMVCRLYIEPSMTLPGMPNVISVGSSRALSTTNYLSEFAAYSRAHQFIQQVVASGIALAR